LPRSKDEALKLLDESGLPEPTLVVHTGNGLMPVWALREPKPVSEVMPVQTGVESALRLAAARFGWTWIRPATRRGRFGLLEVLTGSSDRPRSRLL
jgi:hypothetical protein